MNAGGDATMAIALFLLIQHTGVLQYDEVFARAPDAAPSATVVALGLLGGAVAKSAQVPLHTWLPDAMEGPTPVSALIHAATMVVAGVYLLVRTGPLFVNAEQIAHLAAMLGAVTLLMAGLIALVQTDIKRVIAYSTMSQIGYMFVGAATGAYPQAMFHLMTHAFFKALLFLAAGIIIHALTGEQDIRSMGGLGARCRSRSGSSWPARSRSSASRRSPASSRRTRSSPRCSTPAAIGYFLFALRARRHVPDRPLHVPPLLHRLPRREVATFAREHLHEPHGGWKGRCR